MMEVISTFPGKDRFHAFENLSFDTGDLSGSHLRTQLNMDFLIQCFVALSNSKPLGRCALYHNPHLTFENKKAFCVGNYACVNDPEAAAALL